MDYFKSGCTILAKGEMSGDFKVCLDDDKKLEEIGKSKIAFQVCQKVLSDYPGINRKKALASVVTIGLCIV